MEEVTFIITTFKRQESCARLVKSIRQFYHKVKILIGSQDNSVGFEILRSKLAYNSLLDVNVELYNLGYDCGLSYSRNFLAKRVKTEFFLLLEDDFVFTENTSIEKMLLIMYNYKHIGIVGGVVRENNHDIHFEYNITRNKEEVIFTRAVRDLFGMIMCDCVLNFALFRRAVMGKISWDNNIKIRGEHTDFYLRLKDTKWCVAYSPDVSIDTIKDEQTKEYKDLRQRDSFLKLMMYKNRIKTLVFSEDGRIRGYQLLNNNLIKFNR